MMRNFTFLFLFLALVFTASFPSCKKFEGSQTVPAYIRIDTIELSCDYYTYGANTHKFIDAWVYVDDEAIGCFELPATFPVLKQGKHKVSIRPGICVNGIKRNRSWYPFLNTYVREDVTLTPDSITRIRPTVTYLPNGDNLHVRWLEDFDEGTISMEPTTSSDTSIIRADGPLAWHDPEGLHSTYSGKIVLSRSSQDFCIATSEEFRDLSSQSYACMLEMDYKCSDTLLFGLYYLEGSIHDVGLIRLKPTGESGVEPTSWNKIYINLGPYLVDYDQATYYKFYLASWSERNEGLQYFYFDNLKILYRDR